MQRVPWIGFEISRSLPGTTLISMAKTMAIDPTSYISVSKVAVVSIIVRLRSHLSFHCRLLPMPQSYICGMTVAMVLMVVLDDTEGAVGM